MTDERLIMAIGRLERALSRAEKAADGAADDGALKALTERHERLRSRTKDAIAALDRLTAAG